MDKLHQEIANWLYLLSHNLVKPGLVGPYYGFSPDPFKVEERILENKSSFWTKDGWKADYGHINLDCLDLLELPTFALVGGSFSCKNNNLVRLKGLPHIIRGSLDCSGNNLIQSNSNPGVVLGDFTCSIKNRYLNIIVPVVSGTITALTSREDFSTREELEIFLEGADPNG